MSIVNNNENKEASIVNLLIYKNHLVKTGFMDKYDGLVNTVLYNAYLDKTTNKLCFQQEGQELCFDFSLTGLPDVNANNSSAGDVLMYNGTNWENRYLGDVMNYVRTTQSSRFPDILNVSSIVDALDKILYPFIKPAFTAFSIPAKQTTLELGQYLSGSSGGNETFTWGVSTLANVSSSSGYNIVDTTQSYNLGLAILPKTTTSSLLNIPYGIRYTTNGASHNFRISTKDIQNNTLSRDLTITWRPKIYWGTSANPNPLNSTEILNLPSSNTGGSKYASSITNSFTMDGNGQFIWIVMPLSFGMAIEPDGSHSRFKVGGLASSYWNIYTVSFTNQSGFTSSYYLYRSISVSYGTSIKIEII